MSLHRFFSLMLVALLAGLTGFVLSRTLEKRRAPVVLSSPPSQALSEPAVRAQPIAQPPPAPSRETPRPEYRQPSALAEETPSKVTVPPGPGEPETPIAVVDNRLSVQVQHRSLAWILEEISHQSGLPILLSDGIKDQMVSIRFQDLPLEQGLQALLKTLDAFFFYGAQGQSAAALQAVWLYPQGQGRRMVPAPPETYASTVEMQQLLNDRDPDQQARAIEVLIERQGMRAFDTVLHVLEDPEEQVRYRALYQVIHSDIALPDDLMQRLVLSDPSPVVRFLALDAMANAPGADPAQIRAVAEQALEDPSAEVQEQAWDILAALDSTSQSPESSEPLQGQEEESTD